MGGGASRGVLTNAADVIITKSFTDISTDLQEEMKIEQEVDIQCTGRYLPTDGGPEIDFENNPSCASCFEAIRTQQEQQHAMIRTKWTSSSAPIPLSYDNEMIMYYQMAQNCVYSCKACVFADFSQTANFSWKTTGSFTTDDVTKMRNAIQGNVTQALNDNQGALDSLMSVLGPKDKQLTITNITNRIMNRITLNVMNHILNVVRENQTIILKGSEDVKNLSQQAATSGIQSVVQKLNLTNTILSEEQWSVYQKLYNDENTVGDLGQILSDTTLSLGDIMDSVMGKVIVAVAVVLTVIILAISIVGIVRAYKKNNP